MAQLRLDESLRAVEAEVAAGHPELALARCMQLQAQYPRAIAIQRSLAQIYLAQRKPRDAVAALDRVLLADPEDAAACCLRSAVYQMQGDTHQAIAWYARACDMRPDDAVLRANYRNLAASLGLPPYSPSRAGLARLYLRGGLYTHAIREWEALIAEQNDALDAQVGLAETLWRGNHMQPATDRCLRILANVPTCIKPTILLAVMHIDAGRNDEALRLALRAVELDVDSKIAWSLLSDRLRAGDVNLQKIILGAANQTHPPILPAPGVAGVGGLSGVSRDVRGVSRPAGISAASPSSPSSPSGARITASSLRELSVQVPQDPRLRQGIRQTEIMLGREETRPETPRPVPAPNYLSNGPSLMPPTGASGGPAPGFMPPLLAEQGINLDEDEVRQGLQWLQWLQSNGGQQAGHAGQTGQPLPPPTGGSPFASPQGLPQGAPQSPAGPPSWVPSAPWDGSAQGVPAGAQVGGAQPPGQPQGQPQGEDVIPTLMPGPQRPGRVPAQPLPPGANASGSASFQAPVPPMTPMAPRQPTANIAGLATTGPATTGDPAVGGNSTTPPRPTGLLPRHTAEELRVMFAELEPASGQPMPGGLPIGPILGAEANGHAPNLGPTASPASSGIRARGASASGPVRAPSERTLEDIERGYAASGFQQVEPQPGLLAGLAAQSASNSLPAAASPSGSALAASAPDGHGSYDARSSASRPSVPSMPFTRSTAQAAQDGYDERPEPVNTIPPAEAEPPAPNPERRLAEARRRRVAGDLDGALGEYEAALRDGPHLLSEVVQDIEAEVAVHPTHPGLHQLLGNARILQGDYLSALESYNHAVALGHGSE